VRIPSKTTRLVVANPENQKMQRKMQMPKTAQWKNAKKMQLPTLHFLSCISCNLRRCIFSLACFFLTLINFCIVFYAKKKHKNGKQNTTAPKQMQQKMQKKCNFQRCTF
jgi:hypothetical protein